MDENGYPLEETLQRVREWPVEDNHGLFLHLKALWRYYDYFTGPALEGDEHGGTVTRWYISTGGWSGHEELIAALRENTMVWAMCWEQSRRGGHYIFDEWEPR